MPIKQSLCYPFVARKGMDPDAVLAFAAETGYAAVEFHFRNDSTESLITRAKAHGLAVASVCGHRSIASGLNDRTQHERIVQELGASLDFADRHQIPNLICFSGNRLPDQGEDEALAACAEALHRVLPEAQRRGVTLNMELLNSKVDHPGYQADRTAWGVKLCERVDHPRFRLLYDIYHMQVMEGDIIRTIRDNLQWIGHVHTAGNPGRHDLDDEQELNYPAIARALAAAGYDGYVSHEFTAKGDPLPAMQKAFEIFEDLPTPAAPTKA